MVGGVESAVGEGGIAEDSAHQNERGAGKAGRLHLGADVA
jgi:hypothetical protein